MSTVTYDTDLGIGAEIGTGAIKPARSGWLRRFFAALAKSRMRMAEREIRRYRHLLPDELKWAAYKLGPKSEDQLPFLRRFD
jgi:hypothetical protein